MLIRSCKKCKKHYYTELSHTDDVCDFCKDNEYNINWYNQFKYKDKYGNYQCPCRCTRGYASEHDGQCSKCRTNDQQYKFDAHRKELIKQELI